MSLRKQTASDLPLAPAPGNLPSTPMQLSPYVSELALYDIAGTPGVAADVSHINSKAAVKGYAGACCGCCGCMLLPALSA